MNDLFKKYQINPEDESAYDSWEPRNLLNKYLGDYVPKISVADRKRQINEITDPENAVLSMGMGGVVKSSLYNELAKRMGAKSVVPSKLDENLSKRIADAFESMPHEPHNPEVQKAYKALIDETTAQYDDLINSGLKVNKITGDNPYVTSKDLIDSVRKNNEISYFPTESGFGSKAVTDNPMLQPTGRKNSAGEEMLANDLFRVVHDVYGHVKPSSSFGKAGEDIAYQNHKQMFSPTAQKALATETRGQNSWVNFGPYGKSNQANPASTVYAEQKVGLLPDWVVNENSGKVVRELSPEKYTGLINQLRLRSED